MRKPINIVVLVACILSALALFAYAQRPPDYGPDGTPFLKVNINPTDIPPGVNINPNQAIPLVEVVQMPEVKFTPSGCADGRNFHTGVGAAISGPLLVTYLNTSQQTQVRLVDAQGSQLVVLSPQTQVASAIYLGAGQTLEFDSSIMYSGCRPN